MHLRGTGDPKTLDEIPAISALASEPTELGECRLWHLTFESPMNTATLPSAVHPSIPNYVGILCWDVLTGPYGPSRVVQVRLGSIVNILPRGYVTACLVDGAALGALLSSSYGMPTRSTEIDLKDSAIEQRITVKSDGQTLLDVVMTEPSAVPGGSATVHSSLSLAEVDGVARLVQADFRTALEEPQRWTPSVVEFNAVSLNASGTDPRWPIAGVSTRGTVTLRPVRYTLDPHALPVVTGEDMKSSRARLRRPVG
jgi:hypothetical protein